MSRGMHNSRHAYMGLHTSRALRKMSKLGRAIGLSRLNELLNPSTGKEVRRMAKNLSGYISGSYSATGLDDAKVAAFQEAAQKLNEAGAELGLSTTVSLTVTDAQ